MRRLEMSAAGITGVVICALGLQLFQPTAMAQSAPKFIIKALVEKKVDRLPNGPLYWRVETFPTLAQAQTAAGPTSLAAEAGGIVWLFALGPKQNAMPGATQVAEIGPVPEIRAPRYLLRVNSASAPPGARTPVHTHPGSESFYVVHGQLSQKTPKGIVHIGRGQAVTGQTPGTAMEVSSSGADNLDALVMFVVDATKPFSSPASFERK